MFSNPFAALSATFPPELMQAYVVLMIIAVVGGVVFDVLHKRSAQYFFENAKKAQDAGKRQVSGGEKVSIAAKTLAEDVLTSAEFCNPKRRVAHLLGMYGFIFFVIASAIMVFSLPASGSSSGFWPFVWHVGALMVCVGGYWFWFFIRVDVASEGNPWHRIVRADLFILSLLATATSALLWSLFQGTGFLGGLFLLVFIISSTVLFCGVIWSKFAHMFFKPAAAFQKRVAVADGSLDNLPEPADRTNPADRDRHSMELLRDAPLNMGLGIKREQPHHY